MDSNWRPETSWLDMRSANQLMELWAIITAELIVLLSAMIAIGCLSARTVSSTEPSACATRSNSWLEHVRPGQWRSVGGSVKV